MIEAISVAVSLGQINAAKKRGTGMPDEKNEWIAKRAYELWEKSGRPSGHDNEHWAQATAEWEQGLEVKSGSPAADPWDDEDS